MSRGVRIGLIAAGVLLFLVISGVLARYLSTENVERDRDLVLLQAQAAGDAPGMLRELSGCRAHPACVATVRADAKRLRRPGAVQILSLQSPPNGSLGSAHGETRVAWKVDGRFPVVQCVQVRRSGNFLTGISVALLWVSAPIKSTGDC
jgi:hypothetical protein